MVQKVLPVKPPGAFRQMPRTPLVLLGPVSSREAETGALRQEGFQHGFHPVDVGMLPAYLLVAV